MIYFTNYASSDLSINKMETMKYPSDNETGNVPVTLPDFALDPSDTNTMKYPSDSETGITPPVNNIMPTYDGYKKFFEVLMKLINTIFGQYNR